MYILEYVTEWENGESVLNRFECETYTEAHDLVEQSKEWASNQTICGYSNHSFRIEEVN